MKYPSQPALLGQTILRSDVVLCAQSRRWGGTIRSTRVLSRTPNRAQAG